MDDRVDPAVERRGEHVGVGDVALHDVDGGVGMRLQVDDAHGRAGARQLGDHVAPDEARAAGDEDRAVLDIVVVAHACASVPAGLGSSLEVSRQRTVGMIAARSTRSRWRSTTSNRWSISVVPSSVGFRPRPSSAGV